ncbi:phosphodiester glycosidase family protein [Butyricicoccus sp.]|uniref:phosphodiester glycosidase family protein n=1 Tax=Butyricicoccus sp. TaxID=2049021 RepID=UPI003F186091
MRKKLPVWALVLLDLAAAAACVGAVLLVTYILPQGSAVVQEQDSALQQQFALPSQAGSGEAADGLGIAPASTNDWSHADTSSLAADQSEIDAFRAAEKTRETVQEYTGKTSEITIEKVSCTVDGEPLVYFVADIYVASTRCIKTAFAQSTYGRNIRDYVDRMARDNNALFAVSGDSYGESSRTCVIRNGTLYSSDPGTSDVCMLYLDGTMKTYSATQFDAEQAVQDGAWQAWTFGPALLDSGEILDAFHSTEYLNKVNPRCAIGYIAPGHYLFVLVDGRQDGYSAGATMSQLAALMQEEGCQTAYNLDGGKSAVMYYNDDWVNHPISMGREISDCIYIAAEEE